MWRGHAARAESRGEEQPRSDDELELDRVAADDGPLDALQGLMLEVPSSEPPGPRAADVRRAACAFPWRTGAGPDCSSPRALSILTVDALALLA